LSSSRYPSLPGCVSPRPPRFLSFCNTPSLPRLFVDYRFPPLFFFFGDPGIHVRSFPASVPVTLFISRLFKQPFGVFFLHCTPVSNITQGGSPKTNFLLDKALVEIPPPQPLAAQKLLSSPPFPRFPSHFRTRRCLALT